MPYTPIEPPDHCRFYNFLSLKRLPYINLADSIWSIMSSGDSPAHHNRTVEAFDFNPDRIDPPKPYLLEAKSLPQEAGGGRGSPVATTSRDVAVQSGKGEDKAKGEVQASVLVEPGGGRDKDKEEEGEEKFFGSPTLNNEEEDRNRDKDDERRLRDNGDGGYGGKDRRKDDKFRKNGNIDKLDGVWIPKDKKPQNESEDDNCIVKCLYVTMTCCECSIM
ncbi:probable pre-mRNA-splicing factor ATP-dependent RNA helicase DEAH5 isoform X2 [Sitophilus oryzae]|uniref:Probable pre-mRNA-splicing factor ATP-dependent RNA helicase DEAH5 isoform X2 n=1 Tax=Sitophilus oryzae TaxID=7048 RepID=A0A6J2YQ37_SITOR|nr:probable pre-mRNA-splicing factor ATP-dependent RNA helicase DEAH5 isoform X2 [Sitophilus oryzae]